jgi:hypothetical protein
MTPRRRKAGGRVTERVLAFDISSVCVGWSVWVNGELERHGKFGQQGEDHGERLACFRHWLLGTFKQFTPDQVVYERPYSGRRRNAYGVLQLYVAALLIAHWEHFEREIPVANSVPAREVKRRNRMRKGKDHEANKRIAVLLANRLYGLRLKYKSNDRKKAVSQDDVADAILLGRAWLLAERPFLVPDDRDDD